MMKTTRRSEQIHQEFMEDELKVEERERNRKEVTHEEEKFLEILLITHVIGVLLSVWNKMTWSRDDS